MSTSTYGILDEIKKLADGFVAKVDSHLTDELRPRATAILVDSALVAALAAQGMDVETKLIALESSLKNLPRESRAVVMLASRDLALQAAFALILKLASA